MVDHGVVSTRRAKRPDLFGFQHPETTPLAIPTTPRTAPQRELAKRLAKSSHDHHNLSVAAMHEKRD
jgi:hypothetical protein